MIEGNCSVLVCLGQKLNADGSLPNTLFNRVEKVCRHVIDDISPTHQESKCKKTASQKVIIFTGSMVAECGKTEAQGMWEYFQRRLGNLFDLTKEAGKFTTKFNIPVKYFRCEKFVVILEEQAHNTVENFLYAHDIILSLALQVTSISIVTNDFHSPRSFLLGNHILSSFARCVELPAPSFVPRKRHEDSLSSMGSSEGSCQDLLRQDEDCIAQISHNIYFEKRMISKLNSHLARYRWPAIPEDSMITAMHQLDTFEHSFVQAFAC
jgi:hypothetical protein